MMDKKQNSIYEGLLKMGPEIAAIYSDGIRILGSEELQAKPLFLGHAAREVDSRLRDFLSLESEKKEIQKKLTSVDLGVLKAHKGHVADILTALGQDLDSPLAKKWISVATQFHSYAHKRGFGAGVEVLAQMTTLWKDYEEILFNLVGNYYNLLDRVDRLLQYDKPSKVILTGLSSLLKIQPLCSYFFKKLRSACWLKTLKEEGYFEPSKNPRPEIVSDKKNVYRVAMWPIMAYFVEVAIRNFDEPSTEITNTILSILDSIIDSELTNDQPVRNTQTSYAIVKVIFNLPCETITDKHLVYIKKVLTSQMIRMDVEHIIEQIALPRLLKARSSKLILKLPEILLGYYKTDGVYTDKYKSIVDKWWLHRILRKHKAKFAELCGTSISELALSLIEQIIQEDKTQFNNIWIPTIEDHYQTRFPEKYDCQLVQVVRDMYELHELDFVEKKVKDLLLREHPIFKRIAVYIINRRYEELKGHFWQWVGNPLEEGLLKHEIYELIKSHSSSFDKKEIHKVLQWIESKQYSIPAEIKDNEQRIKENFAYRKREWLSALLDTDDADVKNLYEKYCGVNNAELSHPGFLSWTESKSGYISSLEPNQLCDMSNADIARFLQSFKGEHRFAGPSMEGLADALKRAVVEKPEKFTTDLSHFVNTKCIYKHSLFAAYFELHRAKKISEWQPIIELIHILIKSEDFWILYEKNGLKSYTNWSLAVMADLIAEISKDDEYTISNSLLADIEEILIILANRTSTELTNNSKSVTDIWSSTRYRVFVAIVEYSMRYARMIPRAKHRWRAIIKEDFTRRLDKKIDSSIEFSAVLGAYLPNIYNLDAQWVINNIDRILPLDDSEHWNAAVQAYLAFSSVILKEIHSLLQEKGHYSKMLQFNSSDDFLNRQMLQHICIVYTACWDRIDDQTSLIKELIDRREKTRISSMIHFMWNFRNEKHKEIKSKITDLWRYLIGSLSENSDTISVIGDLVLFTSFIDRIDDEVFEWLKLSASHSKESRYMSIFVEFLYNQVTITPRKVGEIYLRLTESGVFPTYEEKYVSGIIEHLYKSDEKEIANRICNLYGEAERDYNFLGLRDLYKANNPDKKQ